ncbi:MAG: helix-turn-helix domain-containing protein [Candidatus Dormibacteraceae bacterium]
MSSRIDPTRLDRELARRGWNATALAKASGVSVGTISAARRGRPVSNATLCKIADALRDAPVIAGVDNLLERDQSSPVNGSELSS